MYAKENFDKFSLGCTESFEAGLDKDCECVVNVRLGKKLLSVAEKFAQYRKNRKKCYQNPNGYSLMSRPKIGMFVYMHKLS